MPPGRSGGAGGGTAQCAPADHGQIGGHFNTTPLIGGPLWTTEPFTPWRRPRGPGIADPESLSNPVRLPSDRRSPDRFRGNAGPGHCQGRSGPDRERNSAPGICHGPAGIRPANRLPEGSGADCSRSGIRPGCGHGEPGGRVHLRHRLLCAGRGPVHGLPDGNGPRACPASAPWPPHWAGA